MISTRSAPGSASDRFHLRRPLPWTLQVSFWILIGAALVGLIFFIVSQFQFNWHTYLAKAVHPFEHNGRVLQVTPELAIFVISIGIAGNVLGIAARVVFAFLMRRGLNWVRIVLTVLCGTQVLGTLIDKTILEYASTGAIVFAIILLWLPRSNEFYRNVKADRQLHRIEQFQTVRGVGISSEQNIPGLDSSK